MTMNNNLPNQITDNVTNQGAKLANCVLVVMGVSGCGKTTLAKAIANHYRITFLDADDFHSDEARALMAQGIPLTDAHRAPWVERIKHRLCNGTQPNEAFCLAFSGLKKQHRNRLRDIHLPSLVLHLQGTKATIQARLNQRENHFMAPSLLDSQFDALELPTEEPHIYSLAIDAEIPHILSQAIQIIDQHHFS